MPIFPVLAATTDIRGDMNAAALEPCWNISPVDGVKFIEKPP